MQRRVYTHPNKVQKPRVSTYLAWFVGLIVLAWIFYLIYKTYPSASSPKFANLRTIENKIAQYPDKQPNQLPSQPLFSGASQKTKGGPTDKPFAHDSPDIDSSHVDSSLVVVFSTDCSSYQDWQTLLLFHSALVVGQKGVLIRIASGCDSQKQRFFKIYTESYTQSTGFILLPITKKILRLVRSTNFITNPLE